MDVLLINPPAADYMGPAQFQKQKLAPPLGLGYIAAVLEDAGFSVAIRCIASENMSRQNLQTYLQSARPKIVGITTMVISHNNGLRIASLVRKLLPDTIIVMGGPHVSFLAEQTLQTGSVDVVCCFEGELTMRDLSRYYIRGEGELGDIPGIVYQSEGQIIFNPDRPFSEDLDALPFPARHLLNLRGYTYPACTVTGRGCPFGCLFCAANTLSGTRYRMRSAGNVLAELEEVYHRYGLEEFQFFDDTFTVDHQRVREICKGIINRNLPLRWYCESRVNTIDEDLLDTMYEAGCRSVQFGIESGNDEILRKVKKGITTAQVEYAVEIALRRGLRVVGAMIIGHPWDTRETVEDTLRFGEKLKNMARQLGGEIILAFPALTPLPGTYIYKNAKELGINIVSQNWDDYTFIQPVIETCHLNRQELKNFVMDAHLRCLE